MTEEHSHAGFVAEGAASLEASMLSLIERFFLQMTK